MHHFMQTLLRNLRICLALLGCALVMSALLTACTSPQDALGPLIPPGFAGAEGPQPEQPAAQEGKEEQETVTVKEKLDKTVDLDVAQVSSHLQRASNELKRNYRGMLSRRTLGIDASLLDVFMRELEQGWDTARLAQHAVDELSLMDLLLGFIPLLCCLLLIVLLTLLDRQFATMGHNFQARTYLRVSSLATLLLRSLLLIGGQCLAPLLLVMLSYFPLRAVFSETIWAVVVTETMWLIFGYRFVTALMETLLGLPWLDVPGQHAARLHHVFVRVADVITISLHLLAVSLIFTPPPEIEAFLRFAFLIIIAAMPLALIRLRASVMAVFPAQEESSLYIMLLQWLAKNYFWLLGLTMLLLGMRAFGYIYASTFLLTRAYGLLALALALLFGTAKLRGTFDRRIRFLDANDPQLELLQSIRRLLTLTALVIGSMFATRMLAIHEPLIMLLKTPLLSVQTVEFSLFNVLSAALIVGSAMLASKIVRALLNAKIYPAFGIEVGVAYAVNTLISYAIVVVGFFMVLIALGVNLSALTVVIASLSVGIGFGLQTLTENLISGFIILFGRAVRKGDYITVGDVYGRVEAVGARSVVVRTMDNFDLLIPSKDLVGGTIINWTYRDSIVRVRIPVGVTYTADPRKVEGILCEAARRHEHILEHPAPEVWFVSFGDSSINFELLVYYDCRKIMAQRLKGEMYFHIWDVLAEHDIEIPFPQRDLHVRSIELLPELRSMLKDYQSSPSPFPQSPPGSGASEETPPED